MIIIMILIMTVIT